jgi:Enolase C-terminal domain-like
MLHMGSVLRNLSYAADAHCHHLVDDVIFGGKLAYRDGAIEVPVGPGLGVELDRKRLGLYSELFKSMGGYRFTIAVQHFVEGIATGRAFPTDRLDNPQHNASYGSVLRGGRCHLRHRMPSVVGHEREPPGRSGSRSYCIPGFHLLGCSRRNGSTARRCLFRVTHRSQK